MYSDAGKVNFLNSSAFQYPRRLVTPSGTLPDFSSAYYGKSMLNNNCMNIITLFYHEPGVHGIALSLVSRVEVESFPSFK